MKKKEQDAATSKDVKHLDKRIGGNQYKLSDNAAAAILRWALGRA